MIAINRVQNAANFLIADIERQGYEIVCEQFENDGVLRAIRLNYTYQWIKRVSFTVSMDIDADTLIEYSEKTTLHSLAAIFIGHIQDVMRAKGGIVK